MGMGINKCVCGPMSACSAIGRREQADCRYHLFSNDDGPCRHQHVSLKITIEGKTYWHCDNHLAQKDARCPRAELLDELEEERTEGIVPTLEKPVSDDILEDELLKEIEEFLNDVGGV